MSEAWHCCLPLGYRPFCCYHIAAVRILIVGLIIFISQFADSFGAKVASISSRTAFKR